MEEELIMNDEFSEETVSNIEAENDPLVAEPAETIGNVASENENESADTHEAASVQSTFETLESVGQRSTRKRAAAQSQAELAQESTLESVRRTKKILAGYVIGVERLELEDGKTSTCATLRVNTDKGRKYVVPFEEAFHDQIINTRTLDLNTENGMGQYVQRQRQMFARMFGVTLNFCVKRLIRDFQGTGHDLIVASRREACDILCANTFSTAGPLVKEGNSYKATILSVNNNSLAATYSGIDFVIQKYALTRRFANDLKEYYKPGDELEFVHEDLKIDDGSVSFTPNTIIVESRKAKENHYLLSHGAIAVAQISRIRRNTNGRIDIYAWLVDYDIPCRIVYLNPNDFGREPENGDSVQVIIDRFHENGYIDVRCRSMHGNAGFFIV